MGRWLVSDTLSLLLGEHKFLEVHSQTFFYLLFPELGYVSPSLWESEYLALSLWQEVAEAKGIENW